MSAVAWVLLAVGALAVAPLIATRSAAWPQGLRCLDGFVLAAVAGLVAVDVLPAAVQDGRILLVELAVLGFLGPTLVERLFQASARRAHRSVLVVALVGLFLHSMLDGVALARAAITPGSLLGFGVVLHQLPVGLMVWWVLRDRSPAVTWAVLALMSAATVLGAALNAPLAAQVGVPAATALEAFIGGSLLHVVAHRGVADRLRRTVPRWWESVGAAFGIGFVALVTDSSELRPTAAGREVLAGFLGRLLGLAAESAPALLLAFVAAGALSVLLPTTSVGWLQREGRWRQALRGALAGLPLPAGSFGVSSRYRGLLVRGAPPTAALAFLVAAPQLGIDTLLLSLPFLGGRVALLRLLAAVALAVGVAIVAGRALPPTPTPTPTPHEPPTAATVPRWQHVPAALRAGFGAILDRTAPWMLVGLAAAAMITPSLLRGLGIGGWPAGIDVVVFALLGVPMSACASAATPLVAVLIACGVSPGAGLAFLLSGPASGLPTVGALARLHGRGLGVRVAVAAVVGSMVAGFAANALLRTWSLPTWRAPAPEIPAPWQLAALSALVVVTAASLWRRGPRQFFGELSPARDGSGWPHTHVHAHGHGDDHHPAPGHAAPHHP